MSSNLPQSQLTADIPNAAYPTPGQGLVLGTNGLMDPTTLGGGTRTGTKFLRDDQTWQTAGSITYRKTTPKTVSNTITETDLFNGEITIAANVMGPTGLLRCNDIITDILTNATSNYRFKLKFGATTLVDSGVNFAAANNANRTFLDIRFRIQNTATNAQTAWLWIGMPSAAETFTATTGTGGGGAGSVQHFAARGTATEDTTSSKSLQLTVQHGVASVNHDAVLYSAVIEVV